MGRVTFVSIQHNLFIKRVRSHEHTMQGYQCSTCPENTIQTQHWFLWVRVITGSTQKWHDNKRFISKSICVICNRHVWHANLFVLIRNDSFSTTHLTQITNKYSFYFRFVKYLLYPTYILNLKRKVSNYKNLQGI